jgi:hypothetical protein
LPDVEAINKYVVGWMVPIYWQEDPITKKRLNGLGPKDFARVMDGYGCPECLAIFNTYLPVCVVCGFRRDIQADVQNAPQHWVDHLNDRQGEPVGKPVDIDDFLREVAADKDVEQIKL